MSAPQPREFSHPLLWVLGLLIASGIMGYVFFHWMERGRLIGRDDGPVNFAAETSAKPVDHLVLIADRSEAVLERGQQKYLANCAACHGPQGESSIGGSPAPRNFRTEAYRAEWGGGPHGFYLTLSKGSGGMPAMLSLSDEDRYAVAHYVRETFQKGTQFYVEKDSPAVLALVPAPNVAGSQTGPQTPPHLVEQHERLHPMMSVVAVETDGRIAAAQRWIESAIKLATSSDRAILERIARAGQKSPGWFLEMHIVAARGDAAGTVRLVLADASGDPALALVPATSVDAVVRVLIQAAVPRI